MHKTFVDGSLQSDIPNHMLSRSFESIDRWFRLFGVDLRAEVETLIDQAGSRKRILDLFCGYGVAANELAHELEDVEVIGVDLKTHPDKIDGNPKAILINSDAKEIEGVDDESLDVIYAMAGIAYVDDALKVFQAAHQKLRVGGRAFFYLIRGDKDISSNLTLQEILEKANTGHFEIKPYKGPADKAYYPDESVVLCMEKTGFSPLDFNLTFVKANQSIPEREIGHLNPIFFMLNTQTLILLSHLLPNQNLFNYIFFQPLHGNRKFLKINHFFGLGEAF